MLPNHRLLPNESAFKRCTDPVRSQDVWSYPATILTEAQSDALVAGAKLAGWVRDQGGFISGELAESNDPKDQLEARRVRVACGVGSRVNTNRQTGLRKLLAIQKKGLVDVEATWVKWKKDADTAQKVAQACDRIQASIEQQGKEKVEADMAQDELEELAKIAIKSANRVLRLVNAAGDATPATLATGIGSFQAQHGNVFWRQGPGTPDEPEAPVEPGAPVEPATPVTPS